MTKKRFDCVAMKRKGSRRVYEAVRGMTAEQEVEFWRQRTAEFRREIQTRTKAKAGKTLSAGQLGKPPELS